MDKIIASVITGIMLIGAASAVPSPDDRKKLCESKPFDFVWVEKTKACVPIYPCATSNEKIRDAYCIKAGGLVASGRISDGNQGAKTAIEYYVKNVMNTNVESIKSFEGGPEPVFSLRTTDGGYYNVEFEGFDSDGHNIAGRLKTVCWAYGKQLYTGIDTTSVYACLGINSQQECDDMADFASLIMGEMVEGKVEQLGQKVCWLKNLDGWQKAHVQEGEIIRNNQYQTQGGTLATGAN